MGYIKVEEDPNKYLDRLPVRGPKPFGMKVLLIGDM
jgi:hypothetical protein